MRELKTRVEQAVAVSNAQIGVAIRHVESGAEVMIDADTPVPLASVVKIPVMVEAFYQLRQGRFNLDDRWPLEHRFKALGSGILTELDDDLALTVTDYLMLMTIISDNSATDTLMDRLGVGAIDQRMHGLGLSDIHVVRTLNAIFSDMLPSADPDQDSYALAKWEAEHGVKRDGFSYSRGPDNNVGTPRALTRLIEMIFKGQVIDRAGCDKMLDILLRQQLNDRLPRFLPAGTRIAHKTGSLEGVRNDSGIIYVSDNSHVAITALSTWDQTSIVGDPKAEHRRFYEIDTAFGEIALAAFEAFG